MTFNEEMLNILACPKCQGDIKLLDEKNGLLCERCKLIYPIKDNIPVMLIEDALPADDNN